MNALHHITFVVAVNDRELFENNFLASPCLNGLHGHEILSQENFCSAAHAYNNAIDRSPNELIVFAHQDVILPQVWLVQLENALRRLKTDDPRWGVLGCYGVTKEGTPKGHVYSSGLGVLGKSFDRPEPVQTLDEIVLILRKSSGLRFDSSLPHFHLYGTDVCLAAAQRGMTSYAISAFCIHNTQYNLVLPNDFYECCEHVRRAWRNCLPIHTSCVRLTRSNLHLYERRLHEAYLRYIRRKTIGACRSHNSRQILSECETTVPRD